MGFTAQLPAVLLSSLLNQSSFRYLCFWSTLHLFRSGLLLFCRKNFRARSTVTENMFYYSEKLHCLLNVWWWPGRFHNDKQVMWKHMIYNIVVYTYRCGDDWPVAVVQLVVPQLAVRLRAVAPLLLRHPVRRVLPRRARHRVHVHHQGARVRQLATRRARVTLVTAATCPQHTTNRVYFLFC